MSLRFSRVAVCLLVSGGLLAGCGRGGLGEFDDLDGGVGVDAELNTDDLDDTDIPFDDTGVQFDTATGFDTAIFDTGVDTGRADTGRADTGRADTGRTDTGRVDTGTFDTGTFDTFFPTDTVAFDTFLPPDTIFPDDTASFDTADFDTAVFDTGGPPDDGGILCGPGGVCDPKSEECCVNFGGISCVNKGKCMGGTTLSCSSASSCPLPGQTCCFGGFGGGGTPSATCQFFCIGIRLCATSAECPSGQSCQSVFGGYRICR